MEEFEYHFQCDMYENRTNILGQKEDDLVNVYALIRDDSLVLRKTGIFIKSDLGTKTLFYKDINLIDYDKPGIFHITSNLAITMISGERIVLRNVDENWYDEINQKWIDYHNNQNKGKSVTQDSTYEKIVKYAELYEKGLLTREEFDELKSQLISHENAEEPICDEIVNSDLEDKCPECGSDIEPDYVFCTNCGFKIR